MEQDWAVWILLIILRVLPPSQLEPTHFPCLVSFLFHLITADSDFWNFGVGSKENSDGLAFGTQIFWKSSSNKQVNVSEMCLMSFYRCLLKSDFKKALTEQEVNLRHVSRDLSSKNTECNTVLAWSGTVDWGRGQLYVNFSCWLKSQAPRSTIGPICKLKDRPDSTDHFWQR